MNPSSQSSSVAHKCSALPTFIDRLSDFVRTACQATLNDPRWRGDGQQEIEVSEAEFRSWWGGEGTPGNESRVDWEVAQLTDRKLVFEQDGQVRIRRSVLHMGYLLDCLYPTSDPAVRADARYFAMVHLRRTHGLNFTPESVRAFHTLARSFPRGDSRSRSYSYSDIVHGLTAREPMFGAAFAELCLIQSILNPGAVVGEVLLPDDLPDSEYLLSQVFGLPTAIRGFDSLFGGGGPLFGDRFVGDGRPGRVMVLSGQFGSGKTTLAISLAAAVARKGGLVFMMPLEETPRDFLLYLETFNLLGGDRPEVCDTVEKLDEALNRPPEQRRGIISIVSYGHLPLEARLESIRRREEQTRDWPLRLVVVDPMNAMAHSGDAYEGDASQNLDLSTRRALLARTFAELKERSMNVILVAEDDGSSIVQNLHSTADTALQLRSIKTDEGYKQRFIEVVKNRLQREQRGEHPVSIKPGEGFAIFPSPASIAATERGRTIQIGTGTVRFGWSDLDRVLGKKAIYPGDVIVFSGEPGTSKTDLGLLFATDPDRPPGACTLILPLRESRSSLRRALGTKAYLNQNGRDLKEPIILDGLASGYIQPGRIMQAITDAFESVGPDQRIDRVFIDDVSLWDLNCPFVRNEVTFLQTLVQYLRNKRVVTLFCLPAEHARADIAQASALGAADVHIRFKWLDFRGQRFPVLNVVKSRSSNARREPFDIHASEDSIYLDEGSGQLRITEHGVTAIDRLLFLHSESAPERDYHKHLEQTLQRIFGSTLSVQPTNRLRRVSLAQLQRYATVDRVEIEQVDEFQLPALKSGTSIAVRHFQIDDVKEQFDSWSREDQKILSLDDSRIYAFPYLSNRPQLLYRDPVPLSDLKQWKSILAAAEKWEAKEKGVFFAFDNHVPETYNVLFLEIFLELGGRVPETEAELSAWTSQPLFRDALNIIIRLCARWVQRTENDRTESGEENQDLCEPYVWRTWFASVHYGAIQAWRLRFPTHGFAPLPGNAVVSGKCYLTVPGHSVVPKLALDIIRTMISRNQQLDRLDRGVGLPVAAAYFERQEGLRISPNGVPSGWRFVGNDFRVRRSKIPHYAEFCGILANHLRDTILRGPQISEADFGEVVRIITRDIEFAISGQ